MNIERDFVIFGHRGCMGVEGIGENTLPAFERALYDGADGIEFDVYAVSDEGGNEHLIVMHDDDVRRTTDGEGAVMDLGYKQLRALKVGNEKTETPDQYGESVPTAEEVLDMVSRLDLATGRHTLINIELKGPRTAAPSAALIGTYVEEGKLSLDTFIVSSFDHAQLQEFHQLSPETQTAVLVGDDQFAEAGNSLEPAINLAKNIGSIAVNTGLAFTNAAAVTELHAHNLKAYVWIDASHEVIDETAGHVKQIYTMGADGIFANDPAAAR